MTDKILAWHFVSTTLRDGRPIPPDGKPLYQSGRIRLCENGLHGSERLIDALFHAPGHILCRTEHSGKIVKDDDKIASSTRTILWRIDATEVLRAFARRCALDVAHLWDTPDIVRRYLETGDETLREEAYAAADAAARAADAAYATADAAARAAADAAEAAADAADAADATADAAARAAADAADAAYAAYAAYATAYATADAAARAAADAAARAADAAGAAGAVARGRQNDLLTSMVEAEYTKQKENNQ